MHAVDEDFSNPCVGTQAASAIEEGFGQLEKPMQAAAGIENPDEWFNISKAMAVAGLLHIIHNVLQDLECGLQHYKYLADFVEQLSSFLSSPWS